MKKAVRFALSVQFASKLESPSRAQCRRWVRATLQHLNASRDAHLTLRFVDRAEGKRLNLQFRGRDYATNVLTFDYQDPNAVRSDIVICVPVIKSEARQQKKDPRSHFAHMVVHGVLHAHGLDHEKAAEAEAMEAIEREILARFRIADPYR